MIESPIERKFYDAVTPWMRGNVEITSQVEIQTKKKLRRLDFTISDGNVVAVIECDGAAYHNFDSDLERDVELFNVGAQIIFHFSGSFIFNNAEILAPTLSYFMPEFFTSHVDLSLPCPLPMKGACVRIAANFPGLRPEMAERVMDGWSINTLTTCCNIGSIAIPPKILEAMKKSAAKIAPKR